MASEANKLLPIILSLLKIEILLITQKVKVPNKFGTKFLNCSFYNHYHYTSIVTKIHVQCNFIISDPEEGMRFASEVLSLLSELSKHR